MTEFPPEYWASLSPVQDREFLQELQALGAVVPRSVTDRLWAAFQATDEIDAAAESDRVRESLARGGEAAAIGEIAAAQERGRADLLAAGIDLSNWVPEIGQEFKWSDIVRQCSALSVSNGSRP